MAGGYDVLVLFEGYNEETVDGVLANCSCTLVKGRKLIIVDTMTAWDGEKLLGALRSQNITPDAIDYVICTHGHADHIGNNNLFKSAIHILGYSVSFKNEFKNLSFKENGFVIDEGVYLLPTPGHTHTDISLVVENVPKLGTVVIAGDLFENEDDLTDDNIWKKAGSENEELQKENREKVLNLADWIVPGHGKMFKVKK